MLGTKVLVGIACAALIVLIIGGVLVFGRGNSNSNSNPSADSAKASAAPGPSASATASPTDKLEVIDEKVGTGAEAVAGKTVTVNYVGTLANGSKFDSSYDRNQPFSFALGGGQVIKGWDQGVAGMKVGGKRKLVIPPDLGYGAQGAGDKIPPNSTLVFEIELLDVK